MSLLKMLVIVFFSILFHMVVLWGVTEAQLLDNRCECNLQDDVDHYVWHEDTQTCIFKACVLSKMCEPFQRIEYPWYRSLNPDFHVHLNPHIFYDLGLWEEIDVTGLEYCAEEKQSAFPVQ